MTTTMTTAAAAAAAAAATMTRTAATRRTTTQPAPPPSAAETSTSTTPSPSQQHLLLLPSDVWALVLLHCDSDTALSALPEEEREAGAPLPLLRQQEGGLAGNDDNDDDGPWKYVIKSLFHRQLFAASVASTAAAAAAAAQSAPSRTALAMLPPLAASSSSLSAAVVVPAQQQQSLSQPISWRTWSDALRYRRQLLSNLLGRNDDSTKGGPATATKNAATTTNRRRRRRNAWRHDESLPTSSSSSPFAFVPIGFERLIPGDGGGGAAAATTRLDGTRVRHNPRHVVDVDDNDDDPPMVPFECDTFLWLGPDTDEYLFLHPVKGTVVHANNLVRRPNTVKEPAGDGGGGSHVVEQVLLEEALVVAGSATDTGTDRDHEHEPELSYLGIECKHVVDIVNDGVNRNNGFPTLVSTVVAVGRQWVYEDLNQPGVDRSVITEIKSWERSYYGVGDDILDYASSSTTTHSLHCFGTPRVCRFHHHFFTLDLDATNRQLLLVPMSPDRGRGIGGAENGDHVNAAGDRDDDDMNRNEPAEAGGVAAVAPADPAGQRRPDRMPRARGPPAVENDDEPLHACGSRFLHVLPLVPVPSEGSEMDGYDPRGDMHDSSSSSRSSNSTNYDDYFPRPLAVIDCGAGITSVSSSGDSWAVSTASNELLWYEGGQLVHRHRIVDCVRDALRRPSPSTTTTEAAPSRSSSPERELLLLRSVAHHAAVEAIRFAPFVGPDRAGFVTLSHGESSGSTVLLWTKKKSSRGVDDDPSYHVDAVIRLPLKTSRIPKVHFDGRRLIVSGEDHLGHILLIYVVQSPDDPDGGAELDSSAQGGGGSGGVIASETLRFARRIRHPAMGGLEEHDTLQLSANERFIVVNTRRGHEMMSTTTPAASRHRTSPADGLFVVDAETTV